MRKAALCVKGRAWRSCLAWGSVASSVRTKPRRAVDGDQESQRIAMSLVPGGEPNSAVPMRTLSLSVAGPRAVEKGAIRGAVVEAPQDPMNVGRDYFR